MNSSKVRLYGAVAAAVLLAAAGGYGLSTLQNRGGAEAPGHPADAEHAEEGGEEAGGDVVELTQAQITASGIKLANVARGGGGEVQLAGRVEPMVDARASVGATVGGRVERVLVAPGQSVSAGQPLAVLVSGEAASFSADVEAASAAADAARKSYQRDQRLGDQGVVARQEVEASRAQAVGAEVAARAARAKAAAAGSPNASGRLSVTSPIAGVVTAVAVGPGGFVAPGTIVADVTNPSRVELVFNAPPTLAAAVKPNARMHVRGPTGEFEAEILGVAAGAGAERGATIIRARTTGDLLPPAGTAVSGSVVAGEDAGGMTVPSEAVQTVEGGSVVFVAVRNGFRATPVLVGRQAGGRTEILRGLTGDERIAAANAFLLKAELAKGQAEHGH
ncbi:efflux RND transporter periplasmic adaptor subunit [Phenylobacterium sp.]|uniref:efflux RND transporter periplasmic adaptor subunit n=1 Tax=Phenylobacterium sp. TaxID=1871053 RepID=UPI0035B1BB61